MIIMKSEKLLVKRIRGKTQAKIFKDIEPGDVLQLSIPLKQAGGGYRGTHASYITVKILNKDSNNEIAKSFNQLPTLLANFELQEIE